MDVFSEITLDCEKLRAVANHRTGTRMDSRGRLIIVDYRGERKRRPQLSKVALALPPLVFVIDTHRMGLVERLQNLVIDDCEIAKEKREKHVLGPYPHNGRK